MVGAAGARLRMFLTGVCPGSSRFVPLCTVSWLYRFSGLYSLDNLPLTSALRGPQCHKRQPIRMGFPKFPNLALVTPEWLQSIASQVSRFFDKRISVPYHLTTCCF